MPEPMDTIRRVNSDEPMTLVELYRARTVLDQHSGSGDPEVKEARRRVGAMIAADTATPAEPAADTRRSAADVEAAAGHVAMSFRNGGTLSRDDLLSLRDTLEHGAQTKKVAAHMRQYAVARIDARLHALDTNTEIVEPQLPAAEKLARVVGVVVILGIVAAIIGFFVTRDGDGDDDGGGGGDGRDEIGAAIVCENFVEDRLRAPSTAEFPSTSSYTITGSGTVYTVAGYVDAQNGFGAMIRTDWRCVVQETGTDGEFRLEQLTGLD